MYFLIAALIILVACSAITIKTLIGYNDLCFFCKASVFILVVLGWSAPFAIEWIRKNSLLDGTIYNIISYVGYYLFGLVFILFILLILRDFIWYFIYGLGKLVGFSGWWLNPKNINSLGYANLVAVVLSVGISVYAVYGALRVPLIREVEFSSPKLSSEFHLVQLSDLHIDRSTPLSYVQKVVETINALKPDIIVLTGDILDDRAKLLNQHIAILKTLKAKKGIYFSVGNHETYNGLPEILKEFYHMGANVLLNRGAKVADSKVFVAGIPDKHTAAVSEYLSVNFNKAVQGSTEKDYRILLSHNPEMADFTNSEHFDLILTGHTHGGQIFPFHFLVLRANKYLAGTYNVNGTDVYVSRGAGYWGPPMRVFAPSEITDIRIKPVKKNSAKRKIEADENIKEMRNAQNLGFGL